MFEVSRIANTLFLTFRTLTKKVILGANELNCRIVEAIFQHNCARARSVKMATNSYTSLPMLPLACNCYKQEPHLQGTEEGWGRVQVLYRYALPRGPDPSPSISYFWPNGYPFYYWHFPLKMEPFFMYLKKSFVNNCMSDSQSTFSCTASYNTS